MRFPPCCCGALVPWVRERTSDAVSWKRVLGALGVSILLMLLPDAAYPHAPAASALTCADAWCTTDGLDTALSAALAPRGGGVDLKAAALASHVLNFGVSPLLAVSSALAPPPPHQLVPRRRQALQDAAIVLVCVLGAIGANSVAKVGARRQRPCFHYGRQGETEAAGRPAEQWVSFYSGDATIAAASCGAGLALALVRRRSHARALAWAAGAAALAGSLLRVVALMHWFTDVLVGCLAGFALGFGPPLLLFWKQSGRGGGGGGGVGGAGADAAALSKALLS